MKRLTESQRLKTKKLAKNGMSLNKICNRMNLSKSLAYYWFRKVKEKKTKDIVINDSLETEIGEIMGAFAGDGSFFKDERYSYRVRFYLSRKEYNYAKKLNDLLSSIYKTYGRIYLYESVCILEVTRKRVIEHIREFLTWNGNRTLTIRLRKRPLEYSKNFLTGFCRGMVDTEGWICKNDLMISSISEGLINDMSKSLEILGISHMKTVWKAKERKNLRHAIFFNKKNTLDFASKIGFSNERKCAPDEI